MADKKIIELPFIPNDCVHNAHMFYIKCKDLEERTNFILHMKENEINCAFHYIPLHSAPAGIKFGSFFNEDIYTTIESERLVRLPLWYGMSETDITRIINSIFNFWSNI